MEGNAVGLMNAPFTFQRILNNLFRELLWKEVIVYIDDILLFSDNIDTHTTLIGKELKISYIANLTLNLKKCKFMQNEIIYLGRVISECDIKINHEIKEKTFNFAIPENHSFS